MKGSEIQNHSFTIGRIQKISPRLSSKKEGDSNFLRLLALSKFEKSNLKKTLLFLMVLCLGSQLYGQQKKPVQDSTDIYKKIETYSEKRNYTKILHKWFFKSTKQQKTEVVKEKPTYERFEGKIIRHIIIESKDPFGYSVTDTTMTPKSWLERTGNSVHIKSKEMAIRNFLLLKENKPLDTFLIAESARLLRKQNFIREVNISPRLTANSKDSVDITITTLDSWSLIPKGSYSGSETSIGFRERNILGTGHEVSFRYSRHREDGNDAFDASYTVPNFKNTFISSTIKYSSDFDEYYGKSISVDRAFYSPLTRWAGGIFLEERFLGRYFPDDSLTMIIQNIRYFTQDYWGGHSFSISKGSSEKERSTNLFVSARALNVDYNEKPKVEYDSIDYFSDERFYLASTGVTTRRFVKDSYIFRDGTTEDVPIGIVYSITGGVQHKNYKDRLYLGGQISYGSYFKLGFISTNFEVGSFFNGAKTEQTAYSFNVTYFSRLLHLSGQWKMRQFIKPQFIIGVNRQNSVGDRLTLNDDPGFVGVYDSTNIDENGSIDGFDSTALGTQKYVLALQTQFYSPMEFWGFRLNPFINITMGMLTGGETSYGTDKLYSSIGVGCIVRNDYLVFDSFQFSLTYYPQIPGQGNNIFKTNAFTNDDIGFQDLEIGKPSPVLYK